MKKLIIILSFLCCQFSFAQHPIAIHLTEKDGLPDIEFYDMAEDDEGFIWFACNNGLYRYDGKEFKNYSHPKKRGLSVFNLAFDNQNRLWCTNVTGQFFYVENDKLHLDLDASKELKNERLYEFSFYNNNLLAYSNTFLFRKNIAKNTIEVLEGKDGESKFSYMNSVVKNDTIFFLKKDKTKTVVSYLTKNSDSIQHYATLNYLRLAQLYKAKNNLVYQKRQSRANFERVLVKNNKVSHLEDLSLKDNKLINTIFVENNTTWFLTERGAEVFLEDNTNKIERQQHYFPKKFITKVVRDNQNNYWFSTLRNGVFVVPNININTYNLQEGIGNITAIENVNNTHIYFGTSLGWVGVYDILNHKTNYIKFSKNVSRVRHILFNKNLNDVYVATNYSLGSYIIDAETLKIKYPPKRIFFGGAKSMVFLKDGSLFSSLVQNHSLVTFSKGRIETDTIIKLRDKRVYKTHYNKDNQTLYVANVDEFVAYDSNMNPTFIRYNNEPIFARGIAQTNNGTIWVSTFKDGVLAIKNNKVIKSYTIKNGLLSNQTNHIQADENNVWITTKKGLQYLNTTKNTFKNLTKQDGIESFNINGIEIIGNTVWYSSNLGLFSFDKTKVFKKRTVVNPYFTSVTIADSTYAIKSNYTVGYNDKRIKINFNANTFQSSENTNYQYKLEGVNTNWQNISKGINEVSFNSLEKGNYIFKLRTIKGDKTSEISKIKFTVKGVFYKQWWFFMFLGLLVLMLIVYYYSKQLQKKDKEQKLATEKQQNEIEKTFLKLENLRSQMNPHFVFNALNSIQDYILTNKKDLAGDYLGKFADLIRMYLDQSAKKEILLSEEIETLERYLELEKLRFEDKLQYTVNIDKDVEIGEITIPTMLVQPYVENALKHGLLHKKTVGNLMINFSLNPLKDYLVINVIDDGIGRKKSQEIKENQFRKHTSFATKATQDRLELLNYNRNKKITVHIADANTSTTFGNTGTKVTIQIPI